MKVIKWLFLTFIWLVLFLSIAVTWSLLNLPETESIQISRQPSITFLDKEGRIIAFMEIFMGSQFSIMTYQKSYQCSNCY